VALSGRPPRPTSRGAEVMPLALPPPFAPRPEKSTLTRLSAERIEPPTLVTSDLNATATWKPAALGQPPGELDIPPEFQHLQRTQRHPQPSSCLPPPAPSRVRRSRSEAPPATHASSLAACGEDICCLSRPPLVRNVAAFEKPKEYAKTLRGIAAMQQPVPSACGSSRSSRRGQKSPIDEAIQREFMGEGLALEQAVDARRDAGWAVKHRQLQRGDVGHCCHACRQPLRDMNEEVVVWTGAAIYRRFHPRCAASYILKTDSEKATGTSSGSRDSLSADVVEGYADGWRVPRDDPAVGAGGSRRRAVEAARQWLLSQDPSAYSAIRGDLFTTVTITENGKKKAVPGLRQDQLNILQTRHRWRPQASSDEDQPLECPICFGALDSRSAACVQLPCHPTHVCHVDCIWPWLRKASICPVCRKDLRPLLPSARGSSMPPLARGGSMLDAAVEPSTS